MITLGSRMASAQDLILTRSNAMIQHARSALQFFTSSEFLSKESRVVSNLRRFQRRHDCNAKSTVKESEEESGSSARVMGVSTVNEVAVLDDSSRETLDKGSAIPLTGGFEDRRWINCTWELTKMELRKFTESGNMQWNSVIDAEVKRRKWLEVDPAVSSREGTVVLRRCEVPKTELVARTVATCWNSSLSSKFSKNRCLPHSTDTSFGSFTRNSYKCFPAVKASSVLSKKSIFSNVARLRTHAGDSECAENLAVAPARPKAAVNKGPLPVRFINPPIPDLRRLIHKTAVVHPDALLGEEVEIGPFCTVGPQVKLGNGCKLQPSCHILGETQMGDNCVILTGAVVGADIPGQTIIGDCNTIGHYALVGVKCQDMKYKQGDDCYLYIGNNNDIREFSSVHRSSKPDDNTVVGNDNLIMGSCHVAHDCKIGNGNILANGTLLGGHVVVEDLVHTGGGVAVHQFCHIGSFAFLAGGSMVDRDVPVFMMVAGNRAELRGLNLEGMRRCGFSDSAIKSVRKAYQKLFMNSRNSGGMEERLLELEQDVDLAAEPAVSSMLQSVRDCFGEKRRGICKFKLWASV